MKVIVRGEVKEFNITKLRLKELIEKELKLNPEEILVIDKKNNQLLTHDEVIENDSEIEIRMVISGG